MKTLQTIRLHALNLWVCGLGSGYLRPGPGSAASFAALALYLLFDAWFPLKDEAWFSVYYTSWVVVFVFSVAAVADYLARNDNKDPSEVVIDEIMALLLVLPLLESPKACLLVTLLFRFFDIIKPLGIKTLERKLGASENNYTKSFGVMLDDILAAFYALLLGLIFAFAWFSFSFVND